MSEKRRDNKGRILKTGERRQILIQIYRYLSRTAISILMETGGYGQSAEREA